MSAALAVAAIAGGAMAAGGRARRASSGSTSLPVKAMERALHAKGSVVDGNPNLGLDRTDITNVHIGKVPIKPAFEINGEFDFQPYRKNGAFMDGNIALKPNEINIDGIRVKPATYFATNIADHMNSQ